MFSLLGCNPSGYNDNPPLLWQLQHHVLFQQLSPKDDLTLSLHQSFGMKPVERVSLTFMFEFTCGETSYSCFNHFNNA